MMKQANNNKKAPKFKIRITGFETKPASAFKFNPLNYRRHGDAQREALRTMLGDVGWVQGVIENSRTGNLIDGHARIEEALKDDPDQVVPYLKVDLSPTEEKAVLATLDPIGAMAEVDQASYDQLSQEILNELPDLESLLASLQHPENGAGADDEEPPESKTVEFKRSFKIVIECTSARQQKKIMRTLADQGIEYQVKS
jgi:hypothetical protein